MEAEAEDILIERLIERLLLKIRRTDTPDEDRRISGQRQEAERRTYFLVHLKERQTQI